MNVEQIAPFTACLMGLPDPRIISILGGGEVLRRTEKKQCRFDVAIADRGWRLSIQSFFLFFLD